MQPAQQTTAVLQGHRENSSAHSSGATHPTQYTSQVRHARTRRTLNNSSQRPDWAHHFNLR